jgi:outer membrane PBP1 activator LpoA protein
LIDAMEAVTYAEGLKKFSQLTEITEATLNRAEELKAAAVTEELEKIKKADSEQRSQWGRIGKEKSLASRNRSRDAVLEQYQQSAILQGKSIAGAATALWQWLDQEARTQELEMFSVKTIEGWVSGRRKGEI